MSNDHIDKKHVKQNSFDLEELNDEWDESLEVCENENAVDSVTDNIDQKRGCLSVPARTYYHRPTSTC